MHYSFEPIGVIHSPFREKFGIPRQPLLVPEAKGRLELLPPYNRAEALDAIEGFSHIWVSFVFHRAIRAQWQPSVRPPRLGGNKKVGVFASRSPFRPNPLGLSVVRLEGVRIEKERIELLLSGIDLLDGTPVLDIKPYIPYVDSLPDAEPGYADEPPAKRWPVRFQAQAETQLAQRGDGEVLRRLIVGLLSLDPRPAYTGDDQSDRIYGMGLYDFDLKWCVRNGWVEVVALQPNE